MKLKRLFSRRLVIFLGVLAVLAGAGYLVRYAAWPAYRNWSVRRMDNLAREFLEAGDARNALLTVRKALAQRPNDAEAWRLGVKASDQRGSNEAVLFQRNLCRVEKTTANQLELMRLAQKYGIYSYALTAITGAGADARNLPEYHRLAADIYRHVNREAAARAHLTSLLSLAPGDIDARLTLAELELVDDPARLPADWADRVATLAGEPAAMAPATVLQLRAAVARADEATIRDLAAKLRLRSDLTLPQQLNLVEAEERFDAPGAARRLAEIRQHAAARSADVLTVMTFLAAHGHPEAVAAWFTELPSTMRQDETVQLAVAQALVTQRDWKALEALLNGVHWQEAEPMRLALLAHAYRATDRRTDFAATWKLALIAAGTDARQEIRLLRTVEAWHWEDERYDVLWKLFAVMPGTEAIREPLITHEFKLGHTVNLNKIFARLTEAGLGGDDARNNFAYTSLLLNTNEGRAQLIARDLTRAHPDNASYRSTYSLALYRQGQPAQARALLQDLPLAARSAPGAMLVDAVSAAALGDTGRVALLARDLDGTKMLPEEQALLQAAGATVARADAARDREAKVAAAEPAGADTADGWFALLPDRPATIPGEWRMADTYVRKQDFTGLETWLRGSKWSEQDYLRMALLARAQRERGEEGGALDAWRSAAGLAGRDPVRLRRLAALAGGWNWMEERMGVLDRLAEREPGDAALLAELTAYYRRQARTPDLARVLWRYVNQTNNTGEQAMWCVYYSLLCGTNISAAQTLAARIYAKGPDDARRRTVYAFSLWRQQRAAEAWARLEDVSAADVSGMQLALLQAGVLLELGRGPDARPLLASFKPHDAMPEEIALAKTLSQQAGLKPGLAVQ